MYSAQFRSSCFILFLLTCVNGQVFSHRERVTFSPGALVDTLAYSPVIHDSWTVIDEAGEALDSSRIVLHEAKGIIKWVDALADSIGVTVEYQTIQGLDFEVVGPAWLFLPPLESESVSGDDLVERSVATHTSKNPKSVTSSERLTSTGSLFRGLALTTGYGVDLTGGLDLQLQGILSDGVFVVGSLTDRNLPVRPQGDTRNLEELDQVRISINGQWGGVEVGDIVLKSSLSQVSTFERKLEGMHIRLNSNRWETEGALASTKGRYRSQSIQGMDGRQGPYYLTSHEGSRNVIVLPGTEQVWLNGKRLERGEIYDYTIDYSSGEIIFTPRHTIRKDTRITVDFEYSDLVYNRTTGYFSTSWKNSNSGVTITAMSERDILQSNLDLSLSAADKDYLSGIGDSADKAAISTAYADSQGSYEYVDGGYYYRGAGLGDHTVSFYNVGDQGEYRRVVVGDTIVYKWVPPTQRDRFNVTYAPFRFLKLPTRHDLITADLRLKGKDDTPEVGVALGMSNVDRNMLSSIGDNDNRDFGYVAQARWRGQPLSWIQNSPTAELRIKAQGKGRNFQSAGRWDAIEFRRSWDLDRNPQSYHWQTLDMLLEGSRDARASAQLGFIQADSARGTRVNWGIASPAEAPFVGQVHQTKTYRDNSKRRWYVTEGNIKYNFKRIAPLIRYYQEARDSDSTTAYQAEEWQTGVEARLSATTLLEIGRDWRRDVFEDREQELATKWLVTVARSNDRGTRFAATMTYNQKATDVGGINLNYFMGDLAYVRRRPDQPWSTDIRYRLDRTVLEMKSVIYDSVGLGLGDYRYDPEYDMYVPDEAGTYRRYLIPAGELRPVNTMKSRYRFQADLNRISHRFNTFKDWVQARLILQGQIFGETSTYSLDAYLKPSPADTSIGDIYSRWGVDVVIQSKNDHPQYRLRTERIEKLSREQIGNQTQGNLVGESLYQRSVDLARTSRHQISDQQITLDLKIGFQKKLMESLTSSLRNHDVLRQWMNGTLAGSISPRTRISLTERWQQEVDQDLNSIRVQTVSQSVGVQYMVGKGGRLHFELEQITVSANQAGALPYLLAEGFPRGTSYRFRGNGQMQLSDNLVLFVTTYSRKEVDRQSFSKVNIELRTQF